MPPVTSQARTGPVTPSANFLLIALIFASIGFAIGVGALEGTGAGFVFVVTGFVLGLCLHEFGHAFVARRLGDTGMPTTGYLTIDPRHFTDPVATLVLPVLYTILGGIGLPGGSAPVDRDRVSGKARQAIVAAAGPAMSVAILAVLAGLYGLTGTGAKPLSAVLAVSALFQCTALIVNLVPIPGLDGYGMISPWFPDAWRSVGDRIARHAGLILTASFLLCEVVGRPLLRISLPMTALLGFAPDDVVAGYQLIRLW
ncbi:site-2 protease family protein [Methylobacterium sp. BTF04]|uniref:site-2 protease family protein n=1 Tax=Methylobacterium sp. BTF04 TaxID=2708300 RepID=UPI0013D0E1CE|nr:site-2 protease family protein [Methylobacterium sp. BTF04]NEU13301.1 site-2 protease family protein [Methylobacterium sp. BTF04]